MGEINTIGKVAFIGCGAMGEAILKGILATNMAQKEEISVSLPTAARREHLAKEYGVKTFFKNVEAVNDADIVILAVKPQMVDAAIGGNVRDDKIDVAEAFHLHLAGHDGIARLGAGPSVIDHVLQEVALVEALWTNRHDFAR